jgi:GNAT superfamily N-acetyltransferase
MTATIRLAHPTDALAMGTVWHRAALAGYEGIFPPEAPALPTPEDIAEDWRRAIATDLPGAAVLVACQGGPDPVVVGTVAGMPDPDQSSRGHLRGLYVDPGYWGRGVGRALHDAVLVHFQRIGVRVAGLWVLEANVHARSMLERWGWQPGPGRRPLFPGVDEIFYMRHIGVT